MGVKKGVKAQAQFFARLEVGSEAHWVRLFTSKCELKVVKLATALAILAESSDSDSSGEEEKVGEKKKVEEVTVNLPSGEALQFPVGMSICDAKKAHPAFVNKKAQFFVLGREDELPGHAIFEARKAYFVLVSERAPLYYCAPHNAYGVLVLDTTNETVRTIPCGVQGGWKWQGSLQNPLTACTHIY